jgi:hypothetical protein
VRRILDGRNSSDRSGPRQQRGMSPLLREIRRNPLADRERL